MRNHFALREPHSDIDSQSAPGCIRRGGDGESVILAGDVDAGGSAGSGEVGSAVTPRVADGIIGIAQDGSAANQFEIADQLNDIGLVIEAGRAVQPPVGPIGGSERSQTLGSGGSRHRTVQLRDCGVTYRYRNPCGSSSQAGRVLYDGGQSVGAVRDSGRIPRNRVRCSGYLRGDVYAVDLKLYSGHTGGSGGTGGYADCAGYRGSSRRRRNRYRRRSG